MDADFSIELTREDPILDFPWTDPSANFAYVDLKHHPELLPGIEEARRLPGLGDFLRVVNSSRSIFETAKCDAWATTDLTPEEDIHNASHKFASYVDIVFSATDARLSFPHHEQFAKKLVELLRRAPDTASSVEACVRRCYFALHEDAGGNEDAQDEDKDARRVQEGFYFTLYVSGYGDDKTTALQNWGVALKLVGNAIVQLSNVVKRSPTHSP